MSSGQQIRSVSSPHKPRPVHHITRPALSPAPSPSELERSLGAFGTLLEQRRPPLCPEFVLWLLGDRVDLELGCAQLADGEAPPFWAFCWGAGQALARHVLDHPEIVRGKEVVDLGTGSGIAALAAARAGAARVIALDLDPQARRAAELNADLNGLTLETRATPPVSWDLMLAADVLYETGLRDWVLSEACQRGPVLLADPERTGTPKIETPEIARYTAITLPDVDSPQKSVALHWLKEINLAATRRPDPP